MAGLKAVSVVTSDEWRRMVLGRVSAYWALWAEYKAHPDPSAAGVEKWAKSLSEARAALFETVYDVARVVVVWPDLAKRIQNVERFSSSLKLSKKERDTVVDAALSQLRAEADALKAGAL